MDFDLSEYDQVDEFDLILDQQLHFGYQLHNKATDYPSTKLLVNMSSSDDQSINELNSENDFVFLPAPQPPKRQAGTSENELKETKQQVKRSVPVAEVINQQPTFSANLPLATIQTNNVQINPTGLIDARHLVANQDQNKLSDLMKALVSRSDLIYIAIPCAYCHEQITCPPQDISSWLNHMSWQHNCKTCPICNKMIGLGPKRDIEIMRRHVLDDLDDQWLSARANQFSFSFGLQQHWFSGNKCTVKDPTRSR